MGKSMKILILIVISVLLVGCQGEETFNQTMDDIKQSVEQNEWKQAKHKIKTLAEIYTKEKWKLQLMGDEAEYEGISVELEKLKEAVDAKDKTQIKVGLGEIRGLLRGIYSF
ncbi:DUF4363 family protein [Oceanobacillus senegalensis]|uniref:DUF4363 family protein n=1 Tax=Oceanobacillus senegalensis TaxID=1936063 RepID=UPI0015C4E29C|nr:DUF4363 family protein [Oceanobacillus senegalensis]